MSHWQNEFKNQNWDYQTSIKLGIEYFLSLKDMSLVLPNEVISQIPKNQLRMLFVNVLEGGHVSLFETLIRFNPLLLEEPTFFGSSVLSTARSNLVERILALNPNLLKKNPVQKRTAYEVEEDNFSTSEEPRLRQLIDKKKAILVGAKKHKIDI